MSPSEFASRVVHYSSESLSFLGPKKWEVLALDLENSDSVDSFKSGIKNWRPPKCLCRPCKRYIHQIGYTQISK